MNFYAMHFGRDHGALLPCRRGKSVLDDLFVANAIRRSDRISITKTKGRIMKQKLLPLIATAVMTLSAVSAPAQSDKPNILVIMTDDVGVWNISAYHRGMMGGSTPNIDRIATEGALFTDYYAQQSCTAGRAAFILGQNPFRTGLLKVGLPAAEAARLRHRTDRQESPRRPQRVPPHRPRLR